jgi:hypothetical protein
LLQKCGFGRHPKFWPSSSNIQLADFRQSMIFSPKIFKGLQKLKPKDKTLNLIVNDHKRFLLAAKYFFLLDLRFKISIFKLNKFVGLIFGTVEMLTRICVIGKRQHHIHEMV